MALEVAEGSCCHMAPSVVLLDDVAAQTRPSETLFQYFDESRAVEVTLVDHGGDSPRLADAPLDRDRATVVADLNDRLLANTAMNGGATEADPEDLLVDEYGLPPVVIAGLLGEGHTLLDVARTDLEDLLGLTETDLRALEPSAEGGEGEVKAHLPHHNLVLAFSKLF